MIQIYHNSRCTKSRCAVEILEDSGKPFQIIKYLEDTPSVETLTEIVKKLGIKPFDLIRKAEKVFLEKYKDKTLSDQEWIEAMVENPILIERPIVVSGDKALIARPSERVYGLL
ncbi:arsenate reductase (glutaredoxin) [Pedobacter sp. MW01-1-1]|uniref:arsenate reductase (glutaredoxin) n=1 Tax=Pedobacter sp. MW01-1-1 TaxID=3383027 RepID=UPI003FEECC48